ncbi:MAG TPA: FUSC family membrane protein [Mucilaginibacter sp.]|nr:FUSC family membrane protein [Mucilaginibacter sp.]
MKTDLRDIKRFFYSQYFSDGIRMTAGILFPSLFLSQFHHFDKGITMSLGALCISTIDSPGPLYYKRNAMAIGNLCLFLVAVLTGFARLNVFTLGIEITLLSFLFSMFTVYGNRAAAVGTSALLVMIFMMDEQAKPSDVLPVSLILLAGGLWYLLFSLLFFGIRPYRAAQQILGENITDIAKFIRIKANFYLADTDIEDNYRKLVSQQIQVSQHQDAVREVLFKSRVAVKESTAPSRMMVLTFVDLVDIFGQIMATHYDYNYLREKFGKTGLLKQIADILNDMGGELDNLAFMVLSNTRKGSLRDFDAALQTLKINIDEAVIEGQGMSNIALKKVWINIRDLNERLKSIYGYFSPAFSATSADEEGNREYAKFAPSQDYAPHIFSDNLTFSSGAFKHALRVSLVCLTGFAVSKFIALGHHSYWVLLTIIVILKPGFSLSKQRNYQRLIGTLAGGLIGVVLLLWVPDTDMLFVILVFLMLGTYSFLRLNYVVSVIFMTPYVLILFKFLGVGMVVGERIIDTLIGSTIAFSASYLVFPSWEFELIQNSMAEALAANANYLVKIAGSLLGRDPELLEYKLARKEVFVKSANLSAGFERMTSEPKSKQRKIREVHRFTVLNHILSSYIATITFSVDSRAIHRSASENLKLLKRSISVLNDSRRKLGDAATETILPPTLPVEKSVQQRAASAEDVLLREQLGFINRISADISRITDSIVDNKD